MGTRSTFDAAIELTAAMLRNTQFSAKVFEPEHAVKLGEFVDALYEKLGSSLFCVGKELFRQIQMSCDEVNHIDEGLFVSISPCLRFHSLHQTVGPLKNSIVDLRGKPLQYPIPMRLNRLCCFLHRFKTAVPCPKVPSLQ